MVSDPDDVDQIGWKSPEHWGKTRPDSEEKQESLHTAFVGESYEVTPAMRKRRVYINEYKKRRRAAKLK